MIRIETGESPPCPALVPHKSTNTSRKKSRAGVLDT
uniref:Uncharacterized protein n=1 Tax=Anopheles minimus TaxID=112268 RepID=A0A182WPQ0_9DIPT